MAEPVESPGHKAPGHDLPDDLTAEERRELGLESATGEPIEVPHEVVLPEPPDGVVPLDAPDASSLLEHVDGDGGFGGFFDAWELYADPALTALAAGTMLGVLGVYIIMRNMVFLTAAASQVASLGVVLTYVIPALTLAGLGVAIDPFFGEPLMGAFAFTAAATLWVATGKGVGERTRDTALGMAFIIGSTGTMALGSLGAMDGADLHDVQALLLGSAVAVEPGAAKLVWWVAAGILLLHGVAWRGFREVTVDPIAARVSRLPVRSLEVTLWLSVALAIAVSTRVLGAIPTLAYAVVPAWAAMRVAANHGRALLVAAVLGGASGFAGYILAFVADMPPAAVQPLTAVGLATLLVAGHTLAGKVRQRSR